MKNISIIIIGIFLFFKFLVYSGVFFDQKNPLDVTEYYFNSFISREGYLTFNICEENDVFEEDKHLELYCKYKMSEIKNVEYELKEIEEDLQPVVIKISYPDREDNINIMIKLRKINNKWMIAEPLK